MFCVLVSKRKHHPCATTESARIRCRILHNKCIVVMMGVAEMQFQLCIGLKNNSAS